jgi:hypothetical protein
MNKLYCVYRHIRLDKNEVFYIGIGSEKRPYEKRRRNYYWANIINKTDYKIEILFDDLDWQEACEKEKEFIKLYGRKDLGLGTLVNMTDGGDGTINQSKEVIDKIRLKNTGRKLTDDSKNKIRLKAIGRKASDEVKEKMSISQKNRIRTSLSEETKNKISESKKGCVPKNKGICKYDSLFDSIIKDLQNGFTEKEICEKYNISKGGIYRLKKKIKNNRYI